MEHNDLKPCPFCGYVPTIEKTDWDGYALTDDHRRDCFFRYQNGFNPGRASSFNKHSIIIAWNRRANDEHFKNM